MAPLAPHAFAPLTATLGPLEAGWLVVALWGVYNAGRNFRDALRDDRARTDHDRRHPELAPDPDLATASRDFLVREALSVVKTSILVLLGLGAALLPPRTAPAALAPAWAGAWSTVVAPLLLIALAAALVYGSYQARRNRDTLHESLRGKVRARQEREARAAEEAADRARSAGQPGGVET